jgi:hypothetical protein
MSNQVLVLRTNKADNTSYNEFKWPLKGKVKCADFEPTAECGHGLHGLLWGQGDGGMLNWNADATWCVVEVEEKDIINLDGKVKFPRGRVVMTGSRRDATCYVYNNAPCGTVVQGLIMEGGNNCHVVGGDHAILKGGDYAALTGGYNATLKGGGCATLMGSHYATLKGGDFAVLTGGAGSTLSWKIWDSKSERYRIFKHYVGEGCCKPDVAYKCTFDGQLVETSTSPCLSSHLVYIGSNGWVY